MKAGQKTSTSDNLRETLFSGTQRHQGYLGILIHSFDGTRLTKTIRPAFYSIQMLPALSTKVATHHSDPTFIHI